MSLSDVNVKVNLITRTGLEPVWFPLFMVVDSSQPAMSKAIPYTECSTLQELASLLADYKDSDSRKERKEKEERVKETSLYHAIEVMFLQDGHPNKFAVLNIKSSGEDVLAKVKEELDPYLDRNWRQLVLLTSYPENLNYQLSEYIENVEQRKMFYFGCSSTDYATFSETEGGKTYNLNDYTRTVAVYHPNDTSSGRYPVAAVIGAVSGKTPGSLNYRNCIVNNVPPVALTEEELDTLHNLGFMTLVERAGDTVISTGKSASGERYIDTIDIEDYIVQNLIYNTQKALNENDIVPYNNDGISILENAAVSVMLDCCSKGMIAKTDTNTYEYNVDYPAIQFVPEEDIASREYKLGTVSFIVQGAIDRVEITVDMTL